jgi:hypothetical protein
MEAAMASQIFAAQAVSACGFVVEPEDLWRRRINRAYLAAAPQVDESGFSVAGDLNLRAPAAPSRLLDVLSGPDPWARSQAMEKAGLQAEIVYPTYSWSLFGLKDKRPQAASFEAYNSWVYSFMIAAPLRLHGVALVAACDAGLFELERCAALKFKSAIVPAELGTAFAEELWPKVAALGMPVALGLPGADPVFDPQSYAGRCWAFLRDMAGAGVFQRHQNLKIVVIGDPPPDAASLGSNVSWVATGGLWAGRPDDADAIAAAMRTRDAVVELYKLNLPLEIVEADVFDARRAFSRSSREATETFGRPPPDRRSAK